MAASFQRVSQSLRVDRGLRSMLLLVTALILLATWTIWAFKARITRYEVSDSARIELAGAAYPIQAILSGRLTSFHLTLGQEVEAGEVLAELDSSAERLSLDEERTRLAALKPESDALRSQMQSENDGQSDERRVTSLSQDGAQAQYREAQTQAALAEREAERAGRLKAEGILSEADTERAKAQAQSKRAAAESLQAGLARLGPELQVKERQREVRLRQITGDVAKLDAEMAARAATVRRLEYEIERRRIRAPISGRLGECAPLRPGSHISEGEQLGVILPAGTLQVIAEFQPSAAMGKLFPGQPALLRLQGFHWTQYGSVSARVLQVAGEIRDGRVRVELAVDADRNGQIPLQHGLPGQVEVETERISPAALVLRSAAGLVGVR